MKKKIIILSGLAMFTGIAFLPIISAFEAHIINVTAKIEQALSVNTRVINFGTVFPQEYFEKPMFVTFSNSFFNDDNENSGSGEVSKVDYDIKQMPEPRPEYINEVGINEARTWCGAHYPQTPFNKDSEDWKEYLQNCRPSLCAYLSKTPDNFPNPGNDTGVPPFHDPFSEAGTAHGTIDNNSLDIVDLWTIDLAVPCFKGECAEDYHEFVHHHNPNAVNIEEYSPPADLQGETFGCDLWIETTKVY